MSGARFRDLTGRVFRGVTVTGRVSAIGVTPLVWEARCPCGKSFTFTLSHSGVPRSCGCKPRKRGNF